MGWVKAPPENAHFGPSRGFPTGSLANIMKCLTANECTTWLRNYDIDESPYKHDLYPGVFYIQFESPKIEVNSFTQGLFAAMGDFDGCLLQINDWIYDSDYENEPTLELRLKHGQTKPLIEAPGYLFESNELTDAVDLATLVLERGWSAYLYLKSRMATLLLWEGELVDFWSNYKSIEEKVYAELSHLHIRIVYRHSG